MKRMKMKCCKFTGGIIGITMMMMFIAMWLFEASSNISMYGIPTLLSWLAYPLSFTFGGSPPIGIIMIYLLVVGFLIGQGIHEIIRRLNK